MQPHCPFGKTGLLVPPIVFGSTSLGNLIRAVSGEVKLEIVRNWLAQVDAPVFIDSAGKYGAGMAHEVISRCLSAMQTSPSDVVIMNKLGWRRAPLRTPEPTFEPGAWVGLSHDAVLDISYDGILRCWEEGRELLSPYEATLVSVHDPDEYLAAAESSDDLRRRWRDIRDAYRALGELKQAGQVAGVGVGVKNWRVIQQLTDQCDLDWLMVANSLTIYSHPPELLALLESLAHRGVGIINSALFHAGFLLGGDFFDYKRVQKGDSKYEERTSWRSRFHEVCHGYDVSPFHAAVAFGASPPSVTSVALSSTKPERVAEQVAAVATPLPETFWTALKDQDIIDRDYPYL